VVLLWFMALGIAITHSGLCQPCKSVIKNTVFNYEDT
jgi:hypothetical protein